MRILIGAFRRLRVAEGDELVLDVRRCTIARAGLVVRLSPAKFSLVSWLLAAPSGLLQDELIAAMWCDRADGGPDNPANTINQHMYQTRPRVAPLGIVVRPVRRGRGYPSRYEVSLQSLEQQRWAA